MTANRVSAADIVARAEHVARDLRQMCHEAELDCAAANEAIDRALAWFAKGAMAESAREPEGDILRALHAARSGRSLRGVAQAIELLRKIDCRGYAPEVDAGRVSMVLNLIDGMEAAR